MQFAILVKTTFMYNRREGLITVKESKFGKGIFATRNISQGSIIVAIKGQKLNFSDSLDLGDRESYCLQVGLDKYIIPEPPFLYSNHSCDPNSGINIKLELFALRSIEEDEELLWDYSSSMLERHWTMHCHCGSPSCRQVITDFDLLPVDTQERYRRLGIVLPFIIHHLNGHSKSPMLIEAR